MRHVLIAGGIGAPPLYFLARELTQDLLARGDTESSVTVINAARTRDLLIGMGEFENLRLRLLAMTDDGSHGRQGRAPDLLASLLAEMQADAAPIQLYACGPMVMLRALAEFALARSLPCQVSVETSMPCGIGLCMGCAIPVRDSASAAGFAYARACVEGPVFEAAELLWE